MLGREDALKLGCCCQLTAVGRPWTLVSPLNPSLLDLLVIIIPGLFQAFTQVYLGRTHIGAKPA